MDPFSITKLTYIFFALLHENISALSQQKMHVKKEDPNQPAFPNIFCIYHNNCCIPCEKGPYQHIQWRRVSDFSICSKVSNDSESGQQRPSLRKHAYSIKLKISPPKKKIDKNSDIYHISAQNIDCGYLLELPRRGGPNEYPQSIFYSRNKKNDVSPCKPQFYYIKVGFKGVKII